MNIYLIFGYGIPKDIKKDTGYPTYLNSVFNTIFRESMGKEAVIIPGGGPTNCIAPYEGTEAALIESYLRERMEAVENKDFLIGWRFIQEGESLSTFENLNNANEILNKENLDGPIKIFCEYTRKRRVETIAAKIFKTPVTVQTIDFDITKYRYMDPSKIKKREDTMIQDAIYILENPKLISKHHKFFTWKVDLMRKLQDGGMSHQDAIAEYWKKAEAKMRELMPDHPALPSNN